MQCHQADPFIHNSFIDAARLPNGEPVVPELSSPDAPYYVIGASDWDMRTIHIEGNGCLDCHRIGMKTVEEFVGDGWDPIQHMPPYDPGSLKEDFQELLEAWKALVFIASPLCRLAFAQEHSTSGRATISIPANPLPHHTNERVLDYFSERTTEMKRSAIALTLVALVCSQSLAQESERREPETREAVREERSAERERREYDQNKLTVKDPAGFKTDGKQIFSGPQLGETIPAFKAISLVGDNKGEEIDPITVAADKPQILFFQDESGVAIRGLFGVVDAIGKIDRRTEKDLHVACVFLTDDPDSIIDRFGGLFSGLRERGVDVIAVSQDGRDGPGALGLNRTVSQTIILARDGKVTRNFVFRQGMLYADPHVMGGFAELIGEDRDTVAGWLSEAAEGDRIRMRRGDDRQSAAKGAFRKKLGEFVRAGKITREEAGELYQAAFPESR